MVDSPGTYALILQANRPTAVRIGSIGNMLVKPGFYIYVGSALGSGGLGGRLSHHLKPVTRPHWHVDYLRQIAKIIEIWYLVSAARLECEWAQQLSALPGVGIPLKKIGASDCGCLAHLFSMQETTLPKCLAALEKHNAISLNRLTAPDQFSA